MGQNQLCGIGHSSYELSGLDENGRLAAYTPEGITKLCEGLEGSAIDSLECAAAP